MGSSESPSPLHEMGPGERRALLTRLGTTIAAIPRARLAYAFGSFTRGEPFRDLDVAILLDEPFTWRDAGRIGDDVRENLGATPCPVDVVPLNDAPPAFRMAVADKGEVVHEREPREAIEFSVRACSEVMDLGSWRRAHGLEP